MSNENIFYKPFDTTTGLIPFDHISEQDYEPAIERAMAEHDAEIAAIVSNEEPPTFDNTIVALERSGSMLDRVLGIFYAMQGAMATDGLMEIAQRVAPRLSEHSTAITLNRELWHRIEVVRDNCDRTSLDAQDAMLLERTVIAFERSGAALDDEHRERYRELTKRLTQLTLQFEQNVLQATATGELWLDEDEVKGLPDSALEAAAQAAQEKGGTKPYLITLYAPSYMAFMRYASRRDLRERLYKMQNSKAVGGNFDNRQVLVDIANTRLELAQLLGHKCYADFRLQRTMAGDVGHVTTLLLELRKAYRPAVERELKQLRDFATKHEGKSITLMPWDYSYYANKLRDKLFDYNEEQLRPYFELNRVIDGVFGLATRLYGLQFAPVPEAPTFDPNVKVYRVSDSDGTYLGSLYTDFFPRQTKQSGAWMTDFAEQHHDERGNDVRPIVSLSMNFTKPTATKPSLLTPAEVRTFVHEFGHSLHSLLSQCRYSSMAGTNVYRDFVELPSQFMENYVTQREFLDSFAEHYVTGEKIPDALIDKVIASAQFGAGYACWRQLSFGLLDMAWHTITEPFKGDVALFETEARHSVAMFDEVDGCLTSPHFGHIFSGGYAAGYYGYKWAEMLEADAFERFTEEGIFNPTTAQSFRECILSRGATAHPMELYARFRGQAPRVDALLHRDGII